MVPYRGHSSSSVVSRASVNNTSDTNGERKQKVRPKSTSESKPQCVPRVPAVASFGRVPRSHLHMHSVQQHTLQVTKLRNSTGVNGRCMMQYLPQTRVTSEAIFEMQPKLQCTELLHEQSRHSCFSHTGHQNTHTSSPSTHTQKLTSSSLSRSDLSSSCLVFHLDQTHTLTASTGIILHLPSKS